MKKILLCIIAAGFAFAPTNAVRAHEGQGHGEKSGRTAKTVYTCPMHPSVVLAAPGSCPICGMTLVAKAAPVKVKDVATTSIFTGEVIDMSCYLTHDSRGPDHKDCAVTCVKSGLPIGLLTADGKIFLLVDHGHGQPGPYADLRNRVAEIVTVTGDVHQRGGVRMLVAETVAAK